MAASPLILKANQSLGRLKQINQASQLTKAMDKIKESAGLVYQQGPPAKSTITVKVPENLVDSRVGQDFIFYKLEGREGNQSFYRFFEFNVSGSLPKKQGQYSVVTQAEDGYVNITTE